jgi:hypothetical protein
LDSDQHGELQVAGESRAVGAVLAVSTPPPRYGCQSINGAGVA